MLEVCGCGMREDELQHLMGVLRENGSDEALGAAATLAEALANGYYAQALRPVECETILRLTEPGDKRLVALRYRLGLELGRNDQELASQDVRHPQPHESREVVPQAI